MTIQTEIKGNTVTIWRERKPTKSEKKADPEANIMAEVVTIEFGHGKPKISTNRDLCTV